jgi:hypothetical protein
VLVFPRRRRRAVGRGHWRRASPGRCASCATRAAARRNARCGRWCWPSRPALDAGEITDKGYVNQRAVLQRRAAEVARLHARAAEDALVVRLR